MSAAEKTLSLVPSPASPTITPERPGWGVYEHWVINETGRKLRPGVYWHGFKRTAVGDDDSDESARPITDDWLATPAPPIATTAAKAAYCAC